MRRIRTGRPRLQPSLAAVGLLAVWGVAPSCRAAEPSSAAVAGFNSYVETVEGRLDAQHRSPESFLAGVSATAARARLRGGELMVEKLTPDHGPVLPGAILHDWRGTVFVGGATAAEFDTLMHDFAAYPHIYAPQVLAARVLAENSDAYQVKLRVRQKHVLTVVLDTTYDVSFGGLDAGHIFSFARSLHIVEIDDAGTPHERALSPADEHGFLWRMNTYWTCEERDGGIYVQIESVSLTRSIPVGLGWVIGPFVESVPRESLQFTLRATRDALRKQKGDRRQP